MQNSPVLIASNKTGDVGIVWYTARVKAGLIVAA